MAAGPPRQATTSLARLGPPQAIYAPLPDYLRPAGRGAVQTPRELVLEATGRPEAFDERVLGKAMALVNPPKKDQPKMTRKRRPMNRPERRPEAVSAARARQLHVFDIPKDQCKYSLYLGLHHLWTQYIATVIGTETSFGVLHPKLLKADFHGAIVTVVQSRCPSYVGHSGILLREAASMLFIIERSDRLIGIPKAHSIFSLAVGPFTLRLFGDQIGCRPGERTAKKFKGQNSVDL